ncbi:MAG TPA: dienelactone hydrolase family protein [Chloroflexota bacterium]|nr:dienelactone hydrolase family protein [Chloroflexota bacterium]
MNDVERYVIEEFIEEYRLGQYGHDELRRRLVNCGAGLSLLDGLPVVAGRTRPAMFAGGDNPWQDGGQDVEGQMATYKSGADTLEAFIARPKAQGPKPGVVVCHENRGLVEYVKDVALGLASHGYVAIAPDLLTREGPTHTFADPGADVPPLLAKIPPERHVGDLRAAVDYLIGMNVGPVGAIGFCFGGGQTWRLVTREPRLAAAVPFYGPNPPLDDVANITAPVLAIYGGLDERINAGIEAITAAMKQHNKTFEHTVYPDSQHAFHNHTNSDRYNAATAKQAWAQALAWFKRYLG